jgi:hypothetical protein
MKINRVLSGSFLALGLSLAAYAADNPTGYFDFGPLPPSSKGDYVEVNLHPSLLSFAAKLTQESEPDAADVIKGLKQVRVNVVKLDDSNREAVTKVLSGVNGKLTSEGWDHTVSVREHNDSNVDIYVKVRSGDVLDGLVVTVLDGNKEAVFVNIVGEIHPEQIGKIAAKYNIDPLKKFNAKNGKCTATLKNDGKGLHVDVEAKVD